MKLLIGSVLLVLLMVGIIWLLGRSLPVSHETTLERMINAPAEEAWSQIENPRQWTLWRTDLKEVEVLSEDSIVVTDSNGPIRYRLERHADRTLVTTIDQQNLPFGGEWRWSVDALPQGRSKVTITEAGEIYNPFLRFFARYVFGYDATIKSVLDQLEMTMMRTNE